MATTQAVLGHWTQGARRGKVVSARLPKDAETKIGPAFSTAT